MKQLLYIIFLFSSLSVFGQGDLLKELEASEEKTTEPVLQTFKGTRIVNGHSVETKSSGELEFIINHRFGALYDRKELYGLDQASIRYGLEYGITDRLGAGIGRSSTTKEIDAYLKYKMVSQTSGEKSFPFTTTLFGSYYRLNATFGDFAAYTNRDRNSFSAQILLARKFSSAISFQLSPTLLHRNKVNPLTEVNDLYALGLGGRVKITKSVALNLEYFIRINEKNNNPYYNAYGVGIDIETGGHVFQLVFTNSIGSMDRIMLTQTGDPNNTDGHKNPIHFGFNITRTFQVVK